MSPRSIGPRAAGALFARRSGVGARLLLPRLMRGRRRGACSPPGAALAQAASASTATQAAPPPAAPASNADKLVAADLLFKRLLLKPDDLDAGFQYAQLETELGDYEAAIGALERMLYYNPNLPRVKLQLGVLYFHLHSYEMARNYFNSVLNAPDTPADVRTEVQTYIAAVDKAVAINQLSIYGQFGLAYQTNANAGPNSPNVLALGQNALLSPQFQKTPDWNAFGLVTAHDFYDFNDQRGDGWESDLIAYYSQQFRVTRLDLGLVELRTGPRFGIGDYGGPSIHPYAIGNVLTLGGANYLNTAGAGVSLNWPVNETLTITPGFEFRNRWFSNSAELSHRRGPKRRAVDRLCVRFGADFGAARPVVAGPRLLYRLERELWALRFSRFLDRSRDALFFCRAFVRAHGVSLDAHALCRLFLHALCNTGPARRALHHPRGQTMAGVGNLGYDLLPQHWLHAAGPISAYLFDRPELQPAGFPRRGGADLPLLIFKANSNAPHTIAFALSSPPLGAVLAISAARADTVGTAGAVNTVASGTLPAGPTRVLEIGAQVVSNEKIQTTASGSVQVLFIDKTTLNVGPNSTLVIDRFVYNPATTNGQLALSLGKGVVRVVGGVATHSEGATIRTPVAAIGLRGGIAIISHSGAKGTQAILGFGHMSVTTLCGTGAVNCNPTTVQVSRPGFGVTVAGFNKSPSSPGRASSEELAKANGQLTSNGGQSGGASQQPTDSQAASYNVGTPNGPGSLFIATATQGRANANVLTIVQSTQQTVQQGSQTTASNATAVRVAAQQLASQLSPAAAATPTRPPAGRPPRPTRSSHRGPFSTSPGARAPCPISLAPSPEPAASRSRQFSAIRPAASIRTARRIRPRGSFKLALA